MRKTRIIAWLTALMVILQTFAIPVMAETEQQKQNGLSNSLWKIKNGETFTVGYIGGSITQGVGGSKSYGYANLSFNAMAEKYAREGLTFVKLQKGISGTGSNYGAYRIDAELSLDNPSKVPDLTFVEFSINDNHQGFAASSSRKYMETIARKLYKANPNMDVVFLYTTQLQRLDTIDTWITAHKAVADRYGITQINVGKALIDHIRAHEDYVSDEETFKGADDKNYSDLWLTYMSDYVHPTDAGYQVYSDAIMEVLDAEWSKEVPATQTPMVLSESAYNSVDDCYLAGLPRSYAPLGNQMPATNQNYEISYIDNQSTIALWQTNTKRLDITGGDQVIGFKFTGTGLNFRYRANLYNYGTLKFNIDGKVYIITASSRDWFVKVAEGLPYGEHTVTILSNEDTIGPNKTLYIYGFGIDGDPDKKGITMIDAGDSEKTLTATLSADREQVGEDEEITFTADVACDNPIMDVSFYVNDVLYRGTVTQNGSKYSTKMSGLVVGKNTVKAVVRDSFSKVETNSVDVISVTTNSVIVPNVLLVAGTDSSSVNYTGSRMDLAGKDYNKPLPPRRGLFMDITVPEIPDGYDIKSVTMLSSIFFPDQFSSGKSGKNLFFYPLATNITSDYKYRADTTTYPNNNLATLLTTESVSTHNAPVKYTGGDNYSEYATTGNSAYNYNLYTDVTSFFKNSIYGENKESVTKSFAASYAWNNGITFRASSATEIANPIVFLLTLEEVLDAKFINATNVNANEAFNIELKVNKDDVKSVNINVNGTDYTATKNAEGIWVAQVKDGLPGGKYTVTATVTGADDRILEKTQEIVSEAVINKTCVIIPEVLISAGTAVESNNYATSRIDIQGAGYNKPLPPKRGLFMKVAMPKVDANYNIEKVTMLSSSYFPNQFSGGSSGMPLYFYPLSENITSSYRYKADTEANPDNNLATLLTTSTPSTYNAKVKYTGGTNYSDYATTGNASYNYDLYTDVTNFFKTSVYGDKKDAVEMSFAASLAWDNGITFRATSNTEVKNPIAFLVEVSEILDADFVSNEFARPDEPFGVAIKVNSGDAESVSFNVNGADYAATLNSDGEWAAYIENGLPSGDYEIVATVTGAAGNKADVKQNFYVTPAYKFINPAYSVKLQASDGKMWTVSSGSNYNLKYQNGEYLETLYTSINLSTLTNPAIIDRIYLATSTSSTAGANGYTQFRFEECSEVNSTVLPGGKVPVSLPELGDVIAENTYTQFSLKSGETDYKIFSDSVSVSSSSSANYMKIDVTDYVKDLIKAGKDRLYFRTSVSPINDQTYSFAVNNTHVKLFVKYKDPSVINNHNGTTSYVITPTDYNLDSVRVISAKHTEGRLENISANEDITARKLYTFPNGDTSKIFIWDSITTMKPLDSVISVN